RGEADGPAALPRPSPAAHTEGQAPARLPARVESDRVMSGPAGAVLLAAVALDVALGDPPNRWHPVAWLGSALDAARRAAPSGPAWLLLLVGAASVLALAGVAAGAAALLERLVERSLLGAGSLAQAVGVVVAAWALKCAFSPRGLRSAAREVARDLERGDLDAARRALAFHLVSRPTSDLDGAAVASGAIESVAENLTDSWVAPCLFFVLGGLPAAWAYRAVNTADAMIGYREGALEYLGKTAARLDDALRWVAAPPRARDPWPPSRAPRWPASPRAGRGGAGGATARARRVPTRGARWRRWRARSPSRSRSPGTIVSAAGVSAAGVSAAGVSAA